MQPTDNIVPQTVYRVRNFSNAELKKLLKAMEACSDSLNWIGDRDMRQCWEDYDFSDIDWLDWLVIHAEGKYRLPTSDQWRAFIAPIRAKRDAEIAPIWAKRDAEIAPIRAKRDAEIDTIWAKANAEIDTIWAKANAEIAPIWAKANAEIDTIRAKRDAEIDTIRAKRDAEIRAFIVFVDDIPESTTA